MEQKNRLRVPKFAYVFFGITALAIITYAIAVFNTPFADFFNRYISSIFRAILALLTNIYPLSFSETLLICSPVILFFIFRYALKKYSKSWRDVGVFLVAVISVIALIFSSFIFIFGIGYQTSSLDIKLGLNKKEVSTNELASTADWLIKEIDEELKLIKFEEKSSSINPHTLRETNKILLDSYDSISEKYEFIPKLTSFVKPVVLSEPMTYTHISGVYTYFTGEANVNTNAPDYSIPYTMAHELAHQRGIAREDEANFIAFMVCVNSNDPYVRYCGYMNLCEYVLNALYSADQKLWEEAYKKLDNRAIYEMIAYNEFYKKYQDNIVGEISGAINDAYLQANGTEGTKSYGLVVDLAVAYFHKEIEN